MRENRYRRLGYLYALSFIAIIGAAAAPARAQGFISPMVGLDFGGISGCPQLDGCTNQQTNLSIAAGVFGTVVGTEAEIAYAPRFFGKADELSSNVLTVMGNVMLGPRAGPFRPYLVGGLGVMKTHFELSAQSLLTNDTSFGYNAGGGVFAFVGDHFGLRADLRYFHSFPEVTIRGFTFRSPKLNYSRISAGVVLKF